MTSPDYYDSFGFTTYPANNGTKGTTTTIKIGGTNYDNFPAPQETNAVTIAYVESSVSQSGAIQFTKPSGNSTYPPVLITTTSASCYNQSYGTYYVDVSALIGTSSTPISNDPGVFPNPSASPNTIQFGVTSTTGQFPGSPTIIQLELNVVPSANSPFNKSSYRQRMNAQRSPAFR